MGFMTTTFMCKCQTGQKYYEDKLRAKMSFTQNGSQIALSTNSGYHIIKFRYIGIYPENFKSKARKMKKWEPKQNLSSKNLASQKKTCPYRLLKCIVFELIVKKWF